MFQKGVVLKIASCYQCGGGKLTSYLIGGYTSASCVDAFDFNSVCLPVTLAIHLKMAACVVQLLSSPGCHVVRVFAF